ncbi:MAG: hypothetical protein AAGB51_02480 [Planctomycetota bacterium]
MDTVERTTQAERISSKAELLARSIAGLFGLALVIFAIGVPVLVTAIAFMSLQSFKLYMNGVMFSVAICGPVMLIGAWIGGMSFGSGSPLRSSCKRIACVLYCCSIAAVLAPMFWLY